MLRKRGNITDMLRKGGKWQGKRRWMLTKYGFEKNICHSGVGQNPGLPLSGFQLSLE
jgi:hypothetical protein